MASRRKTGKKTRRSRSSGGTAQKKVASSLREMKRGTLRSGRSKKKVTSRKQAIGIGLSEARERGAQVPARKKSKKRKSSKRAKSRSAR
jgi:hypothetical protein